MNKIIGIFYDVVDWATEFVLRTFSPWLWEHKMWLIALIPLFGAYALYKFLWT